MLSLLEQEINMIEEQAQISLNENKIKEITPYGLASERMIHYCNMNKMKYKYKILKEKVEQSLWKQS